MNRSTFLIIINWNATCVSTSRCLIKTPFITERQTLPLHFFLKKWMGDYKYIKLLGFMKPGREAKCNFLSLESDAPWLPPLFLTGECRQSIVAVTVILCCQENPVSLAVQQGLKTMAQQETSRFLTQKRPAEASRLQEWAALWSFTLKHADGHCWTSSP